MSCQIQPSNYENLWQILIFLKNAFVWEIATAILIVNTFVTITMSNTIFIQLFLMFKTINRKHYRNECFHFFFCPKARGFVKFVFVLLKVFLFLYVWVILYSILGLCDYIIDKITLIAQGYYLLLLCYNQFH